MNAPVDESDGENSLNDGEGSSEQEPSDDSENQAAAAGESDEKGIEEVEETTISNEAVTASD